MKQAQTIFIDNAVSAFQAAQSQCHSVLSRAKISEVALWGCAATGDVVLRLLQAANIKVAVVYDTHRTGAWCGYTILNPHQQLIPRLPVVVASSRAPAQLKDIAEFLGRHETPCFFTDAALPGAFLPLEKFRNRHVGQRAFVLGNGPSLNQLDMGCLANEITFGSNRVYLGLKKWGLRLKYWGIEDKLVAEDVREEWNAFEGPVKFIPNDVLHWVTNTRNVCAVPFARRSFGENGPEFSELPNEVYWGGTVTYLLLQLAAIMGCNPIYLIGVDFNYVRPDHVKELALPFQWISHGDDPNHFQPDYFGKGRKWHDPNLERMGQAYAAARRHADGNGIRIFNATPGTRLDVFEKVDFSSLFTGL